MKKFMVNKNNYLLYCFFSLVLSSCNIPVKKCTSSLFVDASFTSDSTTFFPAGMDDGMMKNNVCYRKFFLLTRTDTIISFWGVENDTIKIIRNNGAKFNNPYTVPFLPLNGKKGDTYKYTDSDQITEDLFLLGNPVRVTILDKKTPGNDDTIYTIRHTAIPKNIMDSSDRSDSINLYPFIERIFEVSLKRGIIGYNIREEKGIEEIETYW